VSLYLHLEGTVSLYLHVTVSLCHCTCCSILAASSGKPTALSAAAAMARGGA